MEIADLLGRRIDAALGRISCDIVITNTSYLDVFSCQWLHGDIGVIDGTIVGLGDGIKAKRAIDGKSLKVVPGFIDAHVHLESSLMMPESFEKVVLPKGTTTAISDPHEIANVMGIPGIQFMLNEASRLNLDLKVMLSSCVPATHMETNGGGTLSSSDLLPLKKHAKALGLAEVMNVPGVLHKDSTVLKKLADFMSYPKDGHCPLLRGQELSAYASTGISSCHESSQLEEAREKLVKGMRVWVREGSVAKDLKNLIPLLNMATSPSIGFCTDDRNPLDITTEGHIDHLVRSAIGSGVAPEIAFRSASWSVANHYSLDRGLHRIGAIAPGYAADLVLLSDINAVAIHSVLKGGRLAAECDIPKQNITSFSNSIRTSVPDEADFSYPKGKVHVIGVEHGKIITTRTVEMAESPGVAKLAVLERYGRGSKPALGFARGFGDHFKGAIASSVGHDSHNLIVVGSDIKDMRTALATLIQSGGGFAVVQTGAVIAHLALPFGGLMTPEDPKVIEQKLRDLRKASAHIGCHLPEPFLQLAFLSLPVIPSLKLTDKGLVDVAKFSIIDVRAA